MTRVATEQLCAWRWNPISGEQMERELARRRQRCDDEAGPEAAPPTGFAGQVPPAPWPAPPPRGDAFATGADPDPDIAPPESAPPSPRPALAARPQASAPFVTSACAERLVRGADSGASPAPTAVTFRNRCGFPIRVLYATRRDGSLAALTPLIQPGEASAASPIEHGFEHPGYAVCSYANASPAAACRLGGSG